MRITEDVRKYAAEQGLTERKRSNQAWRKRGKSFWRRAQRFTPKPDLVGRDSVEPQSADHRSRSFSSSAEHARASPEAVDSIGWKVAKSQRRGCGPSVSVPAALTVLPLERTAASIFFSVVIKGS